MPYVYSVDGERFSSAEFDTREEAIKAARSEEGYENAAVWTGVPVKPKASRFLTHGIVNYLLDSLVEEAGEECGEFAENWLDGIPDTAVSVLTDRVRAVVDQWAMHYGYQPKFFTVEQEMEDIWDQNC
jgi:hypothetical protein